MVVSRNLEEEDMKLFSRRIRGYLSAFLLAFVLSYLLINYVSLEWPGRSNKPSNLNGDLADNKNNPGSSSETAVKSKKRYYAVDGNGRASVNREVIKCSPTLEVEVVEWGYKGAHFSYFLDAVPQRQEKDIQATKPRHFYMVYAMESEPHSGGHESWHNADFFMWYNLDLSFPEPATYFDVHTFLPDLLAPPLREFDQKSVGDLAPLVWVLSNCNAYNRRETYVKKLMDLIGVDSYGFCLRNKDTHTSQR